MVTETDYRAEVNEKIYKYYHNDDTIKLVENMLLEIDQLRAMLKVTEQRLKQVEDATWQHSQLTQ